MVFKDSNYTKIIAVLGVIYSFLFLTGCLEEGGANLNQREAGSSSGGVQVGAGLLALKEDGSGLLAKSGSDLYYADIHLGNVRRVEETKNPQSIAFGNRNGVLYISSNLNQKDDVPRDQSSRSLQHPSFSDELKAFWLDGNRTLWRKKIKVQMNLFGSKLEHYPKLFPTKDDRYLILGNYKSVEVLDSYTGRAIKTFYLKRPLVDMTLDQNGSDILVVTDEEWTTGSNSAPYSKLIKFDWKNDMRTEIDIPNCASKLQVSKDRSTIFMSPTRCRKDPVSIIDLRNFRFVRNLPGFGPVALDSLGERAIAFMDMHNLDESLFIKGDSIPIMDGKRYRLMVIDVHSHRFDTYALGDNIPRYALTPDGNVVLIDHSKGDHEAVRILDFHQRRISNVSGPAIKLENFVITEDSRFVYLLDRGLYELYVPGRRVDSVSLGFVPYSINITPHTQNLILGEKGNSRIRVWDPVRRKTLQVFDIPKGSSMREGLVAH
uniref:Lipoprotein n=1 Tax=Uncultured bacterium HF130_AEPn_1 TaxID=663362 RepID=D0E8J2_UNCHF|nr:hypothetical protein ALOHA_HF130_AEPn_1_13c [uncultured bacterium HF130_AEPn_1]